jgi:hypothetical protein
MIIVTRATPMMIIMIAAAARARRVRAYTVHTARAVLVRNAARPTLDATELQACKGLSRR